MLNTVLKLFQLNRQSNCLSSWLPALILQSPSLLPALRQTTHCGICLQTSSPLILLSQPPTLPSTPKKPIANPPEKQSKAGRLPSNLHFHNQPDSHSGSVARHLSWFLGSWGTKQILVHHLFSTHYGALCPSLSISSQLPEIHFTISLIYL